MTLPPPWAWACGGGEFVTPPHARLSRNPGLRSQNHLDLAGTQYISRTAPVQNSARSRTLMAATGFTRYTWDADAYNVQQEQKRATQRDTADLHFATACSQSSRSCVTSLSSPLYHSLARSCPPFLPPSFPLPCLPVLPLLCTPCCRNTTPFTMDHFILNKMKI